MTYVSDAHKEQMSKIHACKAVQVALIEGVKDLGVDAGNSSVEDYVDEKLGPVYKMFDRPRDAGLIGTDSAFTNANYSLCHCKGFVERGGDAGYVGDLEVGEWAFTIGGYEAARNWIPNYDYIRDLINEVASGYDYDPSVVTRDAVDEVISISMEEDPYEETDTVLTEETEPVIYEEIHSEEGVLLADVATKEVNDIKAELMRLAHEIDEQMKQISKILDQPLPSQRSNSDRLDRNRQACGLR